jgi:hypothetical protein
MSKTDNAGGHADTMRERTSGNRAKFWLLLEADRWLVTGIGLVCIFVALVAVSVLTPVTLRTVVSESDPVETLFQALITAIITGVTLVVTITQLVLSQELGAVGDQRGRMEGSMSFRQDVAKAINAPVSPPEPAAFLRSLLEATRARAEELREAAETGHAGQLRDRVGAYTDSLEENASLVEDRLADAEFGTFDVVLAALDYNYSWKIYEGRRLMAENESRLTEDARDALEAVVRTLRLFGPAREHVKTLYFQWELTNLSRTILYATVPALIVAVWGVLFLNATGTVTGSTAGVDNLVVVVAGATTVSLAPFMLLLAYVLRIATVAKRTLAIGPFVLRATDRSESIDWDDTE